MKKFIAVAASAGIFFIAQSAMAFTGHVNAGDFASESEAVAAGKQVAQKIQAGTYKIALNEVSNNCLSATTESGLPEIQISTSWKNAGGDYTKQYRSQVKYNYKCLIEIPSM
ncbi:hypothetical protein KKA14_02045 [bacterium]|nr:hypothetical protein [bacterium]